jgi:hypothetical protein
LTDCEADLIVFAAKGGDGGGDEGRPARRWASGRMDVPRVVEIALYLMNDSGKTGAALFELFPPEIKGPDART